MRIDPVLIYGVPGSGKTTLVRNLAKEWGHDRCTGFFTKEMRERGSRIGFEWQTFLGTQGTLADMRSGAPRVGKYRVDLQSFESMLPEIAEISAGKILLIDEVGKMECLSAKFCSLLLNWEAENCIRLFTVPLKGTSFIESFKARNQMYLVELTPANRDNLFAHLVPLGQ